ncbi:YdcF family protein [Francisella frigiditurris]|uniref:DUF218 domain-containing protein n=1 Tax=Francisella frigiditurris TaxID=1542390 RepID=A0A1J0KSJ4_9GAMM|nr:ElyC/SanA/YdcF family protein [Francisella frigiditurris]APC96614.1 hypothetical protein KX01_1697 [Francisella frigiditurris]
MSNYKLRSNKTLFSLLVSLTILLSPCISIAFSSEYLDVLAYQQNAVSNIQYDTNVLGNGAGITQRGNPEQAIESLKAAIKQVDQNSYRYFQFSLSLAALQVSNNDLDGARKTYQSVENLGKPFPQIYIAAYSLVWDPESYDDNISLVKNSDWNQTQHYIDAIETAKKNFTLKINTNLDDIKLPNDNTLIIVILGYALNEDGSMDKILIDRLKKGLEASKRYPNAKIIVSGGAAQAGVTESYQMKQWLIKHGIDANQIIVEDKSISTVWNAINSINIIKSLNAPIENLILITSTAHIRRATSVFNQAINNNLLPIAIDNLSANEDNYDIDNPINDQEKIAILKDTLRTAGLWQMPGMVI